MGGTGQNSSSHLDIIDVRLKSWFFAYRYSLGTN